MASPVSHTLVGLSLFLSWRRKQLPSSVSFSPLRAPLPAFILLANLPDIDFLISWLVSGDPNRYHYGWTHTLLFAIITAGIAAAFLRLHPGFFKTGGIWLAAVGSHALVDFFTGPTLGMSRSYGFPWLAPFTMERIASPITLLVGPRHQNIGQFLSLHNVKWILFEALVLTPLILRQWMTLHSKPLKRDMK